MANFYVIGWGRMGQMRARVAKLQGHTLLEIYDPPLGFSKKPPVVSADFAFVCTPPDEHSDGIEIAKKAARIFVEKPNYRVGSNIFVGWSHRYHSSVQVIKRNHQHELEFLGLTWTRSRGIPGGWFIEKSSAWEDLGSHLVDMASYLTGLPFQGKVINFDLSKGDIYYKADWWGGDSWNYNTTDNAMAIGRCGNIPILIRTGWACADDQFTIDYRFKGKGFRSTIDPMGEPIFESEVFDFFNGSPQERYIPKIEEI